MRISFESMLPGESVAYRNLKLLKVYTAIRSANCQKYGKVKPEPAKLSAR